MNEELFHFSRRKFLIASGLIGTGFAWRGQRPIAAAADNQPASIRTAKELWEGYDPRNEPLEIEITKTWDEGSIHFEQLYFTGETWQGHKVRVFTYRAAPLNGDKKPGVIHLHGGGQTASLEWVRYWAGRGYVCVSHDFCGKMAGRAPELVTQWGPTPASMADPEAPRSSLRPTAKFNQWYHWILVARRALTLLEQDPRVDPQRLGVFGISVGGTLTWMVAGCDPRVAAAVPIYGVGQNTYTFPWQSPDDPADEDTRLTRAMLEPEGYAADVQCPLLFMNASNDHHGRLDLGMRTLALATKSSMLREVYTPKYVHHIEPREADDLPLWMDFHLKGIGPTWPHSPQLRIHAETIKPESVGVPKITVTVDQPEDVQSVTIYYGLNNPWPASRFYRTVTPSEVAGANYTGDAPVTSAEDTIFAFANVSYRTGIQLSTRLITAKSQTLPRVGPTLQRTLLIDAMDNDQAWLWWLAGTDPVNQPLLLKPWQGPNGEAGFTHAPPGAFSFATTILGDPQFRSDGTQALLVDLWNATPPTTLEISVAKNFFEPGHTFYKYEPKLTPAAGPWLTLKFQPTDFRDEQGAGLSNWKNVTFLRFSGTAKGDHQTVFKNLRWEKVD